MSEIFFQWTNVRVREHTQVQIIQECLWIDGGCQWVMGTRELTELFPIFLGCLKLSIVKRREREGKRQKQRDKEEENNWTSSKSLVIKQMMNSNPQHHSMKWDFGNVGCFGKKHLGATIRIKHPTMVTVCKQVFSMWLHFTQHQVESSICNVSVWSSLQTVFRRTWRLKGLYHHLHSPGDYHFLSSRMLACSPLSTSGSLMGSLWQAYECEWCRKCFLSCGSISTNIPRILSV